MRIEKGLNACGISSNRQTSTTFIVKMMWCAPFIRHILDEDDDDDDDDGTDDDDITASDVVDVGGGGVVFIVVYTEYNM